MGQMPHDSRVPLPISGSQFDKLGKRLVSAGEITAEDEELLERVLTAYDDALSEASLRLRQIGFEPAARLKTTQTLVEKPRYLAQCDEMGLRA